MELKTATFAQLRHLNESLVRGRAQSTLSLKMEWGLTLDRWLKFWRQNLLNLFHKSQLTLSDSHLS